MIVLIVNDWGGDQHVYGPFKDRKEALKFARESTDDAIQRDEQNNPIVSTHELIKPGTYDSVLP